MISSDHIVPVKVDESFEVFVLEVDKRNGVPGRESPLQIVWTLPRFFLPEPDHYNLPAVSSTSVETFLVNSVRPKIP
jgi:hypothetical protein